MKNNINWAEPFFDNEEFKNVKDCFRTDRFTAGKKVLAFEEKMSKITGAKYALAVSNGTVALDLAFKAIGIKPGDEVIVPAISYFSTASSISYQKAIPVFVDVDIKSCCIDPSEIKKAINKKTKAITFIDYGGTPADYKEIKKVAKKHNIPIILDAAQSLGGKYNSKNLGFDGEISTMSFHLAKIITTIEGGMIFTNKKKIYEDLLIRRNIGEPKNKKYTHTLLGTNARMSDLHAGFGLAQVKKLNQIVRLRKKITQKYNKFFNKEKEITLFKTSKKGNESANFFYPILIDNRDKIAKVLRDKYGIDTRIAYPTPIYNQPLYKKKIEPSKKFKCPNAEKISKRILNLPIFPKMKDKEIKYVSDCLLKIIRNK